MILSYEKKGKENYYRLSTVLETFVSDDDAPNSIIFFVIYFMNGKIERSSHFQCSIQQHIIHKYTEETEKKISILKIFFFVKRKISS